MGYRQLNDQNSALSSLLYRKHKLLPIVIEASRRARRVRKISKVGLRQGEFFLSIYEHKKFGLSLSQLRTAIKNLQHLNIIEKTGRTIQSKKITPGSTRSSVVYKFKNNEFIKINFELGNS